MSNSVGEALRAVNGAFVAVALLSSVVCVLYLTGSLFMLEIYDRVVPSGSVATLVGLAVLAGGLYSFQGLLDVVRMRILGRIGLSLDERIGRLVFGAVIAAPVEGRKAADGMQPVRDLDQVRSFLSSLGPTAFFDLPWMPLFLAICFLFHPLIGWTALSGALVLVVLALLSETLGREPSREAVRHAGARNAVAEAGMRNAEVVRAMRMEANLERLYVKASADYVASQRRASDLTGGLGSTSKVARMALQSAVLGVGAYLVIHGEATPGIMIAGSILAARALAPVELAISHWRHFVGARQSWARLREGLDARPREPERLRLPHPRRSLQVEGVGIAPPGTGRLTVADVTFKLSAGDGLGVIGPSGSGKSSLVRALVGVWAPVRGKVRLDGVALEQWRPEDIGRQIGYLPQDVELFSGSVAQNIARFDPEARDEDIVEAAQLADVHDMILRLPEGYATQIGEGGAALSGGQRQRVALARALYGSPFLIVLDEPNAHLDGVGEAALAKAVSMLRKRGSIVILVAHRPAAISGMSHVMIIADGEVRAFGDKDEILSKTVRPAAVAGASGAAAGLRVIADGGKSDV